MPRSTVLFALFAVAALTHCSGGEGFEGFSSRAAFAASQGGLLDGGIDPRSGTIVLLDPFSGDAPSTCSALTAWGVAPPAYQYLLMEVQTDGGMPLFAGDYPIIFRGSDPTVPATAWADLALLSSDAGVVSIADAQSGTLTLTQVGTTFSGKITATMVFADGGAQQPLSLEFTAPYCAGLGR